jgi:ATP-dependent RNA helicase RhlE
MAIHGNKSQGARTEALEQFKNGSIRILVATDIAARGIDIDHLPHVVNFDLPNVPQDYVHRIGRTGRAGKTGEAVSLVCIDEHKLLSDIEHLLKNKIPQVTVANFEPDPSIPAQPIVNGRRTPPKNQNPSRNGATKGFSQTAQRKNSSKPSHSHQKRNWKKS